MFSLGFLFLFTFVIASPDLFPKTEQQIVVNPSFVWYDDGVSSDITIDMIVVDEENDQEIWVLHYVVQPGDVLGKIASTFGTTVSKIQKVNKLNWPIRPGQKLIIANDDVGFLYSIPENINVKIFANKYTLNLEEFMSLNYIQDESEMLYAGQDVFVNLTNEQAYDNWLLERPKPVVVIKPKVSYKPVINKPQTNSRSSNWSTTSNGSYKKSSVISQWVYKKDIKNGFYAGYCTWYAAIISPEIFPYVEENKQERPFGGNANQRCDNAKKAWFKVVRNSTKDPVKPGVNSLVVYKQWGPSYRWYGHVGKVKEVNVEDGTFILTEMNYAGKFIVTQRKDSIENDNIKCYIYAK